MLIDVIPDAIPERLCRCFIAASLLISGASEHRKQNNKAGFTVHYILLVAPTASLLLVGIGPERRVIINYLVFPNENQITLFYWSQQIGSKI